MKLLFLLIITTFLFSCASKPNRPPIWRDDYGIIHIENPDINQITFVSVVRRYSKIPAGCIRLHNIYLSGTYRKDWQLQTETAKMRGTHVVKQYYNGVNDTMGIAFDCSKAKYNRTRQEWNALRMRNMAVGELERRTYAKGQNKQTKDTIPVFPYKP